MYKHIKSHDFPSRTCSRTWFKGAMSQETGLEVPRCWPQYKRMFLIAQSVSISIALAPYHRRCQTNRSCTGTCDIAPLINRREFVMEEIKTSRGRSGGIISQAGFLMFSVWSKAGSSREQGCFSLDICVWKSSFLSLASAKLQRVQLKD